MTVDYPLLPATTLPPPAIPPLSATGQFRDGLSRHRGAANERDGEDAVTIAAQLAHWPRVFPGL